MRKLLALAFALFASAASADDWTFLAATPSTAVAITSGSTALPGGNPRAVLVCNTGAHDVYTKLGTSSAVTATASSSWLPVPGSTSKSNCNVYSARVGNTQMTYIATISVGGVSTIYMESGAGSPK